MSGLEKMLSKNKKKKKKKSKDGMSEEKARKIVRHGKLHGKSLSEISDDQRKYIFARANL